MLAWLLEPILGVVFRWETRKRLHALRRFFAAALVMLAIGCGGKAAPAAQPEPPAPVEDAPRELAEAPPDTAVLERDGGCWMANDQPVQCPATIVAPDPAVVEHGTQSIAFDPHTFKCLTEGRLDPCPYALLPRLADGVAPTRQNGDDCALGTTRVACP